MPAAGRAQGRPGHRDVGGGSRADDRAAAVVDGAAGRPRGAAVRARQALGGARAPARAGRQRDVGRRLAPAVRLRRSRGRDDGRPRERRPDRRLDAGQAHGSRPRGSGVPQPPLPKPLRHPEAGADPLRGAGRRCRQDHRRRHDLPPGRRLVLRHHDLERRRRGRELVRLVAGRLADGRPPHRREPGPCCLQPGRAPARARSSPASPTSTARTRRSPTWTASEPTWPASPVSCFGSASSASSATSSTARRRLPSTCGTRSQRRASPTGSDRSASSRSGCCASRSSTSSSARTRTPSRTRWRQRCPGS